MRHLGRVGLLLVVLGVTLVGVVFWIRTVRTMIRERAAEPLIPADFTEDTAQLRAALEVSRAQIEEKNVRPPSSSGISEEAVRALQQQLEAYEKKE